MMGFRASSNLGQNWAFEKIVSKETNRKIGRKKDIERIKNKYRSAIVNIFVFYQSLYPFSLLFI